MIAIHEASHAVVDARRSARRSRRQKLSIVARGRTLGTAAHMLTDRDATVMQEPDLRAPADRDRRRRGRRAASSSACVSTGVHDDLHAATDLARSMVTSFGMSQELGPVTIGEQGGEVFLGASLQELGSVGPATLELIDREVERIVGEAVERARTRPAAQLGRRRTRPRSAARARDALRASRSRRLLDGQAELG